MKNFPSSLIRQQNTKNGLGNTLSDTFKNIGTKAMSNILGGDKKGDYSTAKAKFEEGYRRPDLPEMFDNINFVENNQNIIDIENNYNNLIDLKSNVNNDGQQHNNVTFEDPFKLSSSIFSVINTYRYVYKYSLPAIHTKMSKSDDNKTYMTLFTGVVSPSLFNPFNGINVSGVTETIPLINRKYDGTNIDIEEGAGFTKEGKDKELKTTITSDVWNEAAKIEDISDCSIQKLVELSNENISELGLATYRYADFMFCKDLGKIPNNRLITLRKFPAPIGDNIFKLAHPNYVSPKGHKSIYKSYPDIGRLITWFDNDDNKLEDICKYSFHAEWREIKNEIQQNPSADQDEGILSKISNFLSPQNNQLVGEGFSGNVGILSDAFGWGANLLGFDMSDRAGQPYYSLETLTNYDQHRVYEPPNRIASTHIYDGNLIFNHDITLVFRYKLRSYANINPRAAMLDLLGNILQVTYKRGTYWAGESKIYGPQANNSVYEKGHALIDKGVDTVGGIFRSLVKDGALSKFENLQNWITNLINNGSAQLSASVKQAKAMLDNAAEQKAEETPDDKKTGNKYVDALQALNKEYGWTNAFTGMLKNQLGRPSVYAFNSLLSGDDVGLWHLTIGNPRNPIMSIGNLILENAEIEHSGPLGLDDFPTELKVTVTLKHARPRDTIAIEKMYTKGLGTIYKPMNLVDVQKYMKNKNSFGDLINIDDDILKVNLTNI